MVVKKIYDFFLIGPVLPYCGVLIFYDGKQKINCQREHL